MKRHTIGIFKHLAIALALALLAGSAPAFANSVPLQELYRNRDQAASPATAGKARSAEAAESSFRP